jgi:hypothetical protein
VELLEYKVDMGFIGYVENCQKEDILNELFETKPNKNSRQGFSNYAFTT